MVPGMVSFQISCSHSPPAVVPETATVPRAEVVVAPTASAETVRDPQVSRTPKTATRCVPIERPTSEAPLDCHSCSNG